MGWVSALDCEWRTIWIADGHRKAHASNVPQEARVQKFVRQKAKDLHEAARFTFEMAVSGHPWTYSDFYSDSGVFPLIFRPILHMKRGGGGNRTRE
ncbi:MAG: hypothetical protein DME52_11440 [Verrucomicrobia bacterium]|nr:MAG: hypothetical protein DME52_11440 [Verrucomicrobiota bacterium]